MPRLVLEIIKTNIKKKGNKNKERNLVKRKQKRRPRK